MAKKISILNASGEVAYADGGLRLSKSIRIDEIEAHPDFQNLFSIEEELLERISESIKNDGYDNSQPLHIWKCEDGNGASHLYLIDGYTRWQALKNAGAETAPYYEHRFEDFDDAYRYVLSLQVNRRNLDGAELLKNVRTLLGTDFIRSAPGKKSEAIADMLGVSPRTVEKAIAVDRDADGETLEKLENGEISVNKAYNEDKRKKRREKEDGDDGDDDLSDALSEPGGSPAALNFNHSDGIERPHRAPWEESEWDKRLIERYREGRAAGHKEGFGEGFSEGAYAVYEKITELIDSGRTPEEIRDDPMFEDFSPTVILGKFGRDGNEGETETPDTEEDGDDVGC